MATAALPAMGEEESLLPNDLPDEEDAGDGSTVARHPPCRQYIVDRCDGASKVGERRPPLRPCLPPPCVKWCPSVLEQNPVCNLAGSCGFRKFGSDRWRVRIFGLALASNLIGFALTVASCASISLGFDALMAMGFSSGLATSDNPLVPTARMEIGLRAVAVDSPQRGHNVWEFDEFCDRQFNLKPVQYFSDGVCKGCAETSTALVSSLVVSVFLYLPNIFTDFTRMYSNYDVNCQKMFGSFASLVSLFLTLYTMAGYRDSCFSVFYEGVVPFDRQGIPLAPHDVDTPEKRQRIFVNMNFGWRAGNGLICLFAATLLKIVDILCNWLVPTPTITRNKDEQIKYENL